MNITELSKLNSLNLCCLVSLIALQHLTLGQTPQPHEERIRGVGKVRIGPRPLGSTERIAVRPWTSGQPKVNLTFKQALNRLNSSTPGVTFDQGSPEDIVLRAGREAILHSFTVQLPDRPERAFAFEDNRNGDTLVAKWNINTDFAAAAWLWDAPLMTGVIFELDPRVAEPAHLAELLNRLLRWENLGIRKVTVSPAPALRNERWIDTDVDVVPTERGLYSASIWCVRGANSAFLGVFLSKTMLGGYPFWAAYIPERFPPLETRLKGASKDFLLKELGHEFERTDPRRYPDSRDAVLIRSLVNGDWDASLDLQVAVLGPPGRALAGGPPAFETIRSRFGHLLNAIGASRRPGKEDPRFIPGMLSNVPDNAALRRDLIETFLRSPSIDLDDRLEGAFYLAGQGGDYLRPCLTFIGTHVTTEAELDRLREINVPDSMAGAKDQAIRTASQVLGTPK
jgi:hypothetical protein